MQRRPLAQQQPRRSTLNQTRNAARPRPKKRKHNTEILNARPVVVNEWLLSKRRRLDFPDSGDSETSDDPDIRYYKSKLSRKRSEITRELEEDGLADILGGGSLDEDSDGFGFSEDDATPTESLRQWNELPRDREVSQDELSTQEKVFIKSPGISEPSNVKGEVRRGVHDDGEARLHSSPCSRTMPPTVEPTSTKETGSPLRAMPSKPTSSDALNPGEIFAGSLRSSVCSPHPAAIVRKRRPGFLVESIASQTNHVEERHSARRENDPQAVKTHIAMPGKGVQKCTEASSRKCKHQGEVKSLLNKLTENSLGSTMHTLRYIPEASELVLSHIHATCCAAVNLLDTHLLMNSMLLLYLNHIVKKAGEPGWVASIVQAWQESREEQDERKARHYLSVILSMYSVSTIDATLIFGMIRSLLANLSESETDLYLLATLISRVGPRLRKDDPGSLKEISKEVSKLVNLENVKFRIKFLVEQVTDLRNGRVKDSSKQADGGLLDAAVGRMNAFLGTHGRLPLRVEFEAMLAYAGAPRGYEQPDQVTGMSVMAIEHSKKLAKLAKKLHINTDLRRSIFYSIMQSTDYLTAYHSLRGLSLKSAQQKEIINIALHLLNAERQYNPFYRHLLATLIASHKVYGRALRHSFWDRKKLGQLTPNLGQAVGELLRDGVLPINMLSCFRVIDGEGGDWLEQVRSIVMQKKGLGVRFDKCDESLTWWMKQPIQAGKW